MLKFVTLICALLGLLAAVTLESWLRNHTVKTDSTSYIYDEVRSRNSEFWSIQYVPLLIMTAVTGAAIYFMVGRLNAAFFAGGVLLCFVSVFAGARTAVAGSISSSSQAASGDVRCALKAAYRSASVMGLSVSSIALIGLGVTFYFLNTSQLISYIACLGLGACLTSLCLGLSGSVFSGAYSLSVRSDDFTDYSGMFIGSGADHAGTYIMSACSGALLAGVGVDNSGVMSTFTQTSAARYPLIIFAAGIIASAAGIMSYRARIVKNPAAAVTAGNFVTAVIVIAVAAYFSKDLLQSYIYSFCAASGIIAALISGEIIKYFSSDGYVFKRHVPEARRVGAVQSMLFSLSVGMISIVIPAAFAAVSIIVSYKFASYYGIALAAAGVSSMTAVNYSVRGFSINAASSSDIASVIDPEAESPNPADVMLTAAARTDVVGKTYSAVSLFITLTAMFTALSVVGNNQDTNILSAGVFTGLLIGAVSVFVCAGLIIRSIRITSYVLRRRLGNPDYDEKSVNNLRGLIPLYVLAVLIPIGAGAVGGISGLIAFACSAALTGVCVVFMFNDSGKYFDRISMEALAAVIRFMVTVTLVFAPVFTSFGGLL